jgi:hypothetical protein
VKSRVFRAARLCSRRWRLWPRTGGNADFNWA